MPLDTADLDRIAAGLAAAQRVLFVTGAGISAESGLPTYRGLGGLYEQETTTEGVPIEVALSGPMFERRPELTWKYLRQIEEACRGARPNRAHALVAAFARRFAVTVLTQNVDGLHTAAGSTDVIDLHGDVHALRCTACVWRARVADYANLAPLPLCPACGKIARPEVVLFGELLPPDRLQRLRSALRTGFDAVFSVGTTSLFPYIAQPVLDTAREGRLTVEVNPARTPVSGVVDVKLECGAVEAMEAIWKRLGG